MLAGVLCDPRDPPGLPLLMGSSQPLPQSMAARERPLNKFNPHSGENTFLFLEGSQCQRAPLCSWVREDPAISAGIFPWLRQQGCAQGSAWHSSGIPAQYPTFQAVSEAAGLL